MKKRKGHSSKASSDQRRGEGGAQQGRRGRGGGLGLGLGLGGAGRAASARASTASPATAADKPYDSDDENEGFGNWLRSRDGVAYMRLFVVANSLLVFMTVSWSHVWQVVDIVRDAIGL
ncbi:RING-type E3 ubiquitin-protein ligase PPIL2 [Frankliniella fusca]|uniref:RING-type E3 ubiquitin-protein ligase PPIL2 n=1 Tax=Frankliniella fusca TaxID=407009 RepID=A0AAE1HDK5_9NEOP|nr:RING-type E3 ubiquitin-protein ligase PPIL2 [Frankliniella fusca]